VLLGFLQGIAWFSLLSSMNCIWLRAACVLYVLKGWLFVPDVWQLALNLFSKTLQKCCVLKVITYNSLITACAQVRLRAAGFVV
jgi:hypothetical protein